MATLKDHQQAMVDLLASGSGIPASASRLAHAMHDLIDVLYVAFPNLPRTKDEDWLSTRGETRLTITPDVTLDIKDIIRAVEANSPGLNDKALAADVEACRPKDTMFDRARAAERRVKELENTVNQLRAGNQKLRQELGKWRSVESQLVRATVAENQTEEFNWLSNARDIALGYIITPEPEQAGCRKDDTQLEDLNEVRICSKCGADL